MFTIGTKVNIFSALGTGEVIGYGNLRVNGFYDYDGVYHGPEMEPMYLVKLDHGIWNEDNTSYLSIVVIHPDNLVKEG